ncbi:membrane protein [Geomicrobium sp. JCM 19055]|nr:membrane protein [Geomicrobium sp. JCM 19055]
MSMNQAKQLSLYVVGLFSLSLGVSFSIQANLGVSPVSSLPYALTLSSEATIAITTIIVNVIFIFIQMLLYRKSKLRDYLKQIPIVLLFGFFYVFYVGIVTTVYNASGFVGKNELFGR